MNPRDIVKWCSYAREDISEALRASEDISYLVSYPKCGATWLQFMLIQLLADAYDLTLDRPSIKLADFTQEHECLPTIIWTHDQGEFMSETGQRHDPHALFIYGGRLKYRKSRVILLVRDPRDVVVSSYYQTTRRSDKPIEFESLSAFVRDPLYGIRRVLRFYEIWHRNRRTPHEMLLMRYEDLASDGEEQLARILRFFGVDLERTTIDKVYEFSRAENMRQLEMAGGVDGMRVFQGGVDSLKVRRAITGGYKDELSPEDVDFCNRWMLSLPPEFGYTADATPSPLSRILEGAES